MKQGPFHQACMNMMGYSQAQKAKKKKNNLLKTLSRDKDKQEEHTDSEEEAVPQTRQGTSLDIQRGIEQRLQHLNSRGSHR